MQTLFENWREFRKEVLCEADLGPQYTPEEFELENPPRPPGISKDAWDEASRRCLAGESSKCPHKREPWLRDREEETGNRPRRDIEPTPIIKPPAPVQWYPPEGSYGKMSRACRGSTKHVESQVVGSDFVPILNNPGWNVRPDADRNGWCGNSSSTGFHVLAYRHGWARAERDYPAVTNAYGEVSPTMTAKARLRSYESGRHPMSREKAPFLYDNDKDRMPDYKEVEKHMLRYPWYAEYLLDYFLQLREAQGGDTNKKPFGISKSKWKRRRTLNDK